MRAETVLEVTRVGPHTKVTAIGYDPLTRRPIGDISVVLDRAGVQRFIADLCTSADLPEPWRS